MPLDELPEDKLESGGGDTGGMSRTALAHFLMNMLAFLDNYPMPSGFRYGAELARWLANALDMEADGAAILEREWPHRGGSSGK